LLSLPNTLPMVKKINLIEKAQNTFSSVIGHNDYFLFLNTFLKFWAIKLEKATMKNFMSLIPSMVQQKLNTHILFSYLVALKV
jgi:hypothetical protein